jgi:hypothetical protein
MASTTRKEAQIDTRAAAVIQFPTAEERSSTKMNESFFKASKRPKHSPKSQAGNRKSKYTLYRQLRQHTTRKHPCNTTTTFKNRRGTHARTHKHTRTHARSEYK